MVGRYMCRRDGVQAALRSRRESIAAVSRNAVLEGEILGVVGAVGVIILVWAGTVH